VAEEKRRNLGRGLSALLGDIGTPAVVDAPVPAESTAMERTLGLKSLPVETLRPGRYQPRRRFDEESIEDLVESVREKGVLQPILVRPHPDQTGAFEIIAGERRWRAAQRAQLHEIPAIVRSLTDREALEIALVENLQRQDLSPLEEADGYRRLIDEFSHTQEELAKAVGKSRSHVANMMRLLALPDPVKTMVEQGQLTAGHARALLTARDPVALAREVVDKALNVRQTEKLAGGDGAKGKPGAARAPSVVRDADTVALERDLTESLGMKVTIRAVGGKGDMTITFASLEQLDDLLSRLGDR
jgi:ParB family chromosome partitioning protein